MAETVADVLTLIGAGDRAGASALADRLRHLDPEDRLAEHLATHLARRGGAGVYATPAGFQAFIDHASNPPLYDATIAALREVHVRDGVRSVVDVGAGDGRVATAVVADTVETIELVEPSADLLRQALARPGWPVEPVARATTMAGWVESLGPDDRVDLVQSTFALHTTRPPERPALLTALRPHASRIAIVDFDVPDFADRGAEHAAYAVDRYRVAVDEYAGVPAAIDGFLMPVLVGQFDPDAARVTFEQSRARWTALFTESGYDVTTRSVFDYWWAPAFLLEAAPRLEQHGADRARGSIDGR